MLNITPAITLEILTLAMALAAAVGVVGGFLPGEPQMKPVGALRRS